MSDPALGRSREVAQTLLRRGFGDPRQPLTFPAELAFWYLSWPPRLATRVLRRHTPREPWFQAATTVAAAFE